MEHGMKVIRCGEYNYVVAKGHPAATRNSYVYEHRIIAEMMLGRYLDEDEVVHHINGDKKDNRPENLMVMTSLEHKSLHASEQVAEYVELKCAFCGKQFSRRAHKVKSRMKNGSKNSYCNRSCMGNALNKKRRINKMER